MCLEETSIMQITISNADMKKFLNAITGEVIRREAIAIPEIKKQLIRTSIDLAIQILDSPEWKDLKTPKRIAEFGFRPWEVDELDELANRYMIPGTHGITSIETNTTTTGAPKAVLHWVDFPKLLQNPFAMHELTKREHPNKGGAWIVKQVVSWLEWFEYGVTIDNWNVQYPIPPRWKYFSRSGLGLMRPAEGGSWTYPGSYLFEKTSRGFGSAMPALTEAIRKITVKAMKRKK